MSDIYKRLTVSTIGIIQSLILIALSVRSFRPKFHHIKLHSQTGIDILIFTIGILLFISSISGTKSTWSKITVASIETLFSIVAFLVFIRKPGLAAVLWATSFLALTFLFLTLEKQPS